MAASASMNERRTAVRMLQGALVETDATGARPCQLGSPRDCPTPPPQPAALGAQASRRRSACFLLPPTEIIEPGSGGDAPHGCHSAPHSNMGPASPVLCQRRVPASDGAGSSISTAADGPASYISTGAANGGTGSGGGGGNVDADVSPLHLSVPLTLLSLHNGGARHSPRPSRDASPVANLLLSREGSIVHPCDGDGADGLWVGSASDAAPGSGKRPSEHSGVNGTSPPRRSSSMLLRCASIPAAVAAGAVVGGAGTAGAPSPSRASITGGAAARGGGGGTAAASISPPASGEVPMASCAKGGVADGAAAAAACTGAAAAAATNVPAIPMPSHLCGHRPPTPVCKEDDLLASMRHMTSPSRRRSRFASAADSSLLAAAAAAIAAEEAGLLDSPPSAGWGSGGVQAVSEPRAPRRATLSALVSDSGGETGSAQRSAAGAAATTAGSGEFSPRISSVSMSMTWRTASQLVPVPEEPVRLQSREGTPLPSAGPLPSAVLAAAPAAFAASGSAPRAATPGPGLVMGPGGVLSRRFRSSAAAYADCAPEQQQPAGLPAAPSFRAGSVTVAAADDVSGPDGDDALSSFMRNSFGPHPGTPSLDRRCPVATPGGVESAGLAGLGLGAGAVMGPGLAAGARITAR